MKADRGAVRTEPAHGSQLPATATTDEAADEENVDDLNVYRVPIYVDPLSLPTTTMI